MPSASPPGSLLTVEALCSGLDLPPWVESFEHVPGGGVLFEAGALSRLGESAAALGARRALVVTDQGIARTGAADRAVASLEAAGVDAVVFDEVHENPTTEDVARCVEAAKAGEIDLIVGLGGGSSLDTAKGCNFLLTNGGEMKDYWGVDLAREPMLPFIAVPTTSGTGSECQSFALIADAATHAKMACGDKKAAAALAILDPELTLTMPGAVTAHTGIDAIAHAVETAVCRRRGEVSMAYSFAAWRLLDAGFERVMREPGELEARARMQLGAAFAGTAIENSMLGAAHSCANPLTAHYGIVHGQAVGSMLPHVVALNQRDPEAGAIYRRLHPGDLVERLREHLAEAEMAFSLSELGVERAMLPQLAEEAAKQWTAQFNPVEADAVTLLEVYEAAF